MTLDATRRYTEPLTVTRLHDWHAALFPTGRSGMNRIKVGAWRDDAGGPMQVLSGPHGHERVHYQAPPAANLNAEITAFLSWLNSPVSADMVIKAALAHLWFVTIHPFDDGNGRIARAIADMVLAQSEGTSQRFYSLSAQIRRERRAYYDILEQTQKSTLDVTQWLQWFLGCFDRTLEGAATAVESVLAKARVWKRLATVSLNDRQRMVINRLLDGFDGKLTTSKWAKLTKTSQDTALRDIQQLLDQGVLVRNSGGGRSSSYRLSDSGSTSAND